MSAHLSYGTVATIEAVPLAHPQDKRNLEFVTRAKERLAQQSPEEFRAAIPFDFRDFIDGLMLYNREGDDFHLRVVGNSIGMMLSEEPTGKTINQVFAPWPDFCKTLLGCAQKVMEQGVVSGLHGRLHYSERTPQAFETITVPIPPGKTTPALALAHICVVEDRG
ncbi:hypothetical protein [Fodinicurvata sediminis]|uniref:hypothetical protein n=1 Tax=Fodinicurvata sediminis TaxID=1121832 RepID=UPI0003B3571B|nr:hypothetical protein [Fodinicurvata sediminis]